MPKILYVTILALAVVGVARADQLNLPPPDTTPDTATDAKPLPAVLPQRGAHMAEVLREFGEPSVRHAAVGGHEPRHPAITRWDYPQFAVFFEKSVVIDAVVPGHLTPVQTTQGLRTPPP
ncbi:MAG: hypothetical protein ACRESS_01550 [Stenotrophobium sp.]